MRIRRIILALAMLAVAALPVGAADFWGTRLAGTPSDFLFGYGSLMNSQSREDTAGMATVAVPARISAGFGYVREWNVRATGPKFTALGIRPRRPDEGGGSINGVVFPVDAAMLEKFDRRESGYDRVEVPAGQIESAGWLSLPRQGRVWVYVPKPDRHPQLPDAGFPIVQSYVDLCVKGALEHGEDFAAEFLETTQGWSRFWLNDRLVPRRPWVHEKDAGRIDRLLAKFPADPSRNAFPTRLLPEEYSNLIAPPSR
jgi:cation transport regulator ChaC